MSYDDMPYGSRELALYIENEEPLNRREHLIYAALDRKRRAGTYDSSKAVKAFEYVVTDAAKRYSKEYGGKWNLNFSVDDRKKASEFLRDMYEGRHRATAHDKTR